MNRVFFNQWRDVIHIAWPLVIANSFWVLQVTIDRIFIGNYSTDALGAAMAAVGIFWAPMALVQQTAAYVSTFVAQYFGAKQFSMIGPSFWQSVYISIIGGLLFLLLIFAAPTIFEFFGHVEKLKTLETSYFKALCYSALPTAIVAATSGFFTGLGRSTVIMWINASGLIANVFFDYVLIFGNWGFPELGVAGAGYATAIANWVAAVFGCCLVFSKHNEQLYRVRSAWPWDFKLLKRFLKYGVPSGMQWALEGLAFTAFLIFVGRMPNGDAALAASSVTVSVMMLAILPALGVAQAVSVLVGQHLGENKPQLAVDSTWNGIQIVSIYILITGMTFVLFPSFYMNWFRNAENLLLWEEVSVIVPYLLIFVAVFILFDSFNLVFSFALKGAGDTRFVTLIALTIPWPIMVLPTWYISHKENAVYWAWGFASVFIITQGLIFWRRFLSGKWKTMRVIETETDFSF